MIDGNGRLFGLVNLVDLGLGLLLVFGAALGAGTYRVFHLPVPVIERVEPAALPSSAGARVRLVGRNFRHYLRVFAPRTGEPFAVTPSAPAGPELPIESVTQDALELRLSSLGPGTYDLYVFDNARELARLRHAITLAPPDPPRATMRAVVRLLLPAQVASQLRAGDRDLGPDANAAPAERAQIERVDIRETSVDVMDMRVARQLPGDHYLWMGRHTSQVMADVVLRVPVREASPGRWEYDGRPLRAGDRFDLETASAKAIGTVLTREDPQAVRR
ncbi:MAG: hypothetical protein IT176_14450 [Acidobacteria bacterium]|nr:hypothetical protein [Acidobacteriota bacterium]